MKVLILGAGAMGCLYGAAFHRASCEVVFVDVNQPHIDAINANGLELETRAGVEHLPIPARRPEEIDGPVDLIVNPSNCVQCGAITAKGGRLTPPEGGDGPLYQIT